MVARRDDRWGEVPCAFITGRPGVELDRGDIIAFCRARLAAFKVPKVLVFSEIPKTSTGKVQKFILRERANALEN